MFVRQGPTVVHGARLSAPYLAMIPIMDDEYDANDGAMFGGQLVRASRKSCAFCRNRAIVQCDGDRCIRQLCADHRSSAADQLAVLSAV